MQKIDTLRQDIRKAEKLRRELELRTEDALNEASKEKKLREKMELNLKQSGNSGALPALSNSDDANKLKAELERVELNAQETLLSQQSKFNAEIVALTESLDESERRNRAYEMDLQGLKEKVDKARLDSMQENEETMTELRNVYEREKIMLIDENKKLQMDLERAVEMNGRLQLERRQTEEEYAELRAKKEAIAHWEAQISEIINWVSDEKDARGYLQVTLNESQLRPVNRVMVKTC